MQSNREALFRSVLPTGSSEDIENIFALSLEQGGDGHQSGNKLTATPSLRTENEVYTMPFNLSGHPAVVIPIGQTQNGLPIGMQIAGKRWREMEFLEIA